MESKNFVVGVFDDEDVLVEAVGKIRHSGVKIHEVYTPFPVHGLDTALGYNYSNLPIAAFLFGMTGTISALTMIIYMLGFDWEMNIGGKSSLPLPDFIPVTFEATVLLAAFGMTFTFFFASKVLPWRPKPFMFDPRSTDDKFVMAIDLGKNKMNSADISSLLKQTGASEVNSKTVSVKELNK